MSDTSNQQNDTGAGVVDFNPQVTNTANYPPRKFIGFSPLLSTKEQEELRVNLRIPVVPGALLRGPGRSYPQYITQPALYDNQGRVVGEPYNFEDSFLVARELEKLSTDERIRIANEFKRIGWYGSGKPSEALKSGVGWSSDDEKVWLKLFDVANNAQRPWQDMLGLLGSWSSAGVGGTGPKVRVTSDEDAAAYTREVFLRSLGRMPTRKEMADAADFIRNRERQAVASGQQVPDTGLIAQKFAEKADPTSRTVFGLGNAIGLAMQALGQ